MTSQWEHDIGLPMDGAHMEETGPYVKEYAPFGGACYACSGVSHPLEGINDEQSCARMDRSDTFGKMGSYAWADGQQSRASACARLIDPTVPKEYVPVRQESVANPELKDICRCSRGPDGSVTGSSMDLEGLPANYDTFKYLRSNHDHLHNPYDDTMVSMIGILPGDDIDCAQACGVSQHQRTRDLPPDLGEQSLLYGDAAAIGIQSFYTIE